MLECLAERTIGLGQKRRMHDLSAGYDPLLERRMRPLLPLLKEKGARLITNMGSANPLAAGRKIVQLAEEMGTEIWVAVVTGDDVLMFWIRTRHRWRTTSRSRLTGVFYRRTPILGPMPLRRPWLPVPTS